MIRQFHNLLCYNNNMTKTFKEYREEKKTKPEVMETSFGSHSESKNVMETSFGSHSQPKVKPLQEKLASNPGDAPAYKAHELSPNGHDHIHENVAPLHDDKISAMEKEAVHDYSDESTPINSMLHRHAKGHDISTKNTDAYRDTTKYLDHALNRQKTTEDMHVFTGIKYSPAKHFKKVAGKVPETTKVNLPAFTSTSSSIKSARPFSEATMHPNDERHGITYPDSGDVRHIIKIHVPKGSKAASLKAHSFCPEEKEVLLHRGHDIEIHHQPEHLDQNTYLWHAKIVGHKVADLSKPVE